ncbi:collagen alpha-1(I) chain-like [Coturnix japonica]|uniref:collagen alpha-1(I) chain-like n=1 Tax=Coturnix japonica TaxID=93934 RepID=UPI000777C89C|nr:collagen alpha-1(I) chain-like [Coturnix japonica]
MGGRGERGPAGMCPTSGPKGRRGPRGPRGPSWICRRGSPAPSAPPRILIGPLRRAERCDWLSRLIGSRSPAPFRVSPLSGGAVLNASRRRRGGQGAGGATPTLPVRPRRR